MSVCVKRNKQRLSYMQQPTQQAQRNVLARTGGTARNARQRVLQQRRAERPPARQPFNQRQPSRTRNVRGIASHVCRRRPPTATQQAATCIDRPSRRNVTCIKNIRLQMRQLPRLNMWQEGGRQQRHVLPVQQNATRAKNVARRRRGSARAEPGNRQNENKQTGSATPSSPAQSNTRTPASKNASWGRETGNGNARAQQRVPRRMVVVVGRQVQGQKRGQAQNV